MVWFFGAKASFTSIGRKSLGLFGPWFLCFPREEIVWERKDGKGLGRELDCKAFAFEGEEFAEISVGLFDKAHGSALVFEGEDLVLVSVQALDVDVCPRVVWRTDEVRLGVDVGIFESIDEGIGKLYGYGVTIGFDV